MKKIVAIAVAASALLAGPDIGNIIDYDAQDNLIAKTQEAQEVKPTPVAVVAPVVTAPVVATAPIAKKSCCTNRDSIDLMAGYNFTEDDGALDDAVTAGIRYNKNIAPNTYIQFGYDRVFNADYKNRGNTIARNSRSVSGGGSGSSAGGGSNSSNSGNGGNSGNGTNNQNGNGNSNGINPNGNGSAVSSSQNSSTQLDRFYLNGLYEFCNSSKLLPYVFAGFGYENVRHESKNLKSGGFFDTGAGLKYQLNDNLNLITEAKALKKFDNDDLDIIAGLGIGMMFGANSIQNIPDSDLSNKPLPEVNITQEITTPETIPSIIPEEEPLATIKEESIPAPSSEYNSLAVVPVEERGINRSTQMISADSDNRYYIQVAALFESNVDDSSYVQKLDSLGLNYEIKDVTVRNRPVQLLLVGPYSSSDEARADLDMAKKVEKGAFVKKIES